MHPSLLVALLAAVPAGAYDRAAIPVTRWPEAFDPVQVLPEEWEARTGLGGPLEVRRRSGPPAPAAGGEPAPRMVAIVEASLYPDLEEELATWAADLARDGWEVLLESAAGGTADELKAHLRELYAGGLEGALLVGDLPVAWFEVENDYHAYGYAVFPCDLRYMDLDGDWIDQDGNGIADLHTGGTGDVEPEIWVGRMVVTPTMGDPVEILEAYFARNHAFRTGAILPGGEGLVYVDDDWVPWAREFAGEVALGFEEVTLERDLTDTRVADYLPRLTQTWDTIAVFVHSSPEAHYFVYDGVYDLLYWDGVPSDADALFYDLFACSNANFTDYVYMAGVYALQTEGGLLALGSTKTGSMLERTGYYQPLGQGEAFGTAFVRWWASVAPYTIDDVWWYYGLVQVGDPTLRTGYPTLGADPPALEAVADGATPITLGLAITSTGTPAVRVEATTDAAWITLDPASVEVGADPVGIDVTLHPNAAPGGLAVGSVVLDAPGATNGPLVVPVSLEVGDPAVACAEPSAIDEAADLDGDRIAVPVVITNCGSGTLVFEATVDVPWARLRPTGGRVTDAPTVLHVTLDPAGLEAGVHEATLTLASGDGGEPLDIPLALEIREAGDACSGCAGRPGRHGLSLLAAVGALLVLGRRREA